MRSTSAKRLLGALRDRIVSVRDIKVADKDSNEVKVISTEQFLMDLEFYTESGIFTESTDIKIGVVGGSLKVEIGRKSPCSRYVTEVWLDGPEGQTVRGRSSVNKREQYSGKEKSCYHSEKRGNKDHGRSRKNFER